jgi:hypothetical protein
LLLKLFTKMSEYIDIQTHHCAHYYLHPLAQGEFARLILKDWQVCLIPSFINDIIKKDEFMVCRRKDETDIIETIITSSNYERCFTFLGEDMREFTTCEQYGVLIWTKSIAVKSARKTA